LNLFDYALIAIIGLSMVLSLWRGFVREIISLIGLVAAFLVASRTSSVVGDFLGQWVANGMLADILGFAAVFTGIMLLVGLIGGMLRKLVDRADLTATDRTLGVLFGLARGMLLIGLFFLIYTSYSKDEKAWMKDSMLTPYALELANAIGQAIPEGYPFSRQGDGKPPSLTSTMDAIPEKDRSAVKSIIEDAMQ